MRRPPRYEITDAGRVALAEPDAALVCEFAGDSACNGGVAYIVVARDGDMPVCERHARYCRAFGLTVTPI